MRHDEEIFGDRPEPGDERKQGEDEQWNSHHQR